MPTNSPAERVAANVRAEMARRRQSTVALAGRVGVSRSALARRLDGQVPFDVALLLAVAAALDVPVSALIGADVAA